MGLLGGHGLALYVFGFNGILTGPTACAGGGGVVRKAVVAAATTEVVRKARRPETETSVLLDLSTASPALDETSKSSRQPKSNVCMMDAMVGVAVGTVDAPGSGSFDACHCRRGGG